MSAFVVTTDHIDLIVTAATVAHHGITVYYKPAEGGPEDVLRLDRSTMHENGTEAGRRLYVENIKSVQHRYPNDETINDLPGLIEKVAPEDYRFRQVHDITVTTPVALLKALDCYTYQSCEHPGWESSWAARYVDHARASMIACLPGYNDANTWDYDRPEDAPRMVSLLDLAAGRV